MQRWEIKNHWVPVDEKRSPHDGPGDVKGVAIRPQWRDAFRKAWAEAEVLANDGWELISVAPETCADVTVAENDSRTLAFGVSYTAGYLLAFRRPKSS